MTTVRREFHKPTILEHEPPSNLHAVTTHEGGMLQDAPDLDTTVERPEGVQDKDGAPMQAVFARLDRVAHVLALVVPYGA